MNARRVHVLPPVAELRAQPAGSTSVDAELVPETVEEDVVIDGVESR